MLPGHDLRTLSRHHQPDGWLATDLDLVDVERHELTVELVPQLEKGHEGQVTSGGQVAPQPMAGYDHESTTDPKF
jgi:hypothetical protein